MTSLLRTEAVFTECFLMLTFIPISGVLHAAYSAFDSLEDALCTYAGNPMERLCAFFGSLGEESPKKKLNMFFALDDKERSGSGFWYLGEI